MTAHFHGDPLVAVRNLRVSFRLDRHTTFDAVKGISFDIPRDATVALVGESGSGKSVTSLAMLGLLPPENSIIAPTSEIVYGGRNVLRLPVGELRKLRGADISMIFQEPMTSLNPVFTVGEQIAEVLRLHMGLGVRAANARAIASRLPSPWCSCTASAIWLPTVNTGFSDVIGSWKIIEMSAPRSLRSSPTGSRSTLRPP